MALTDKLTAIANAIRGKTGKTDALTLAQMPGEIAEIQTGSNIPDGSSISFGSKQVDPDVNYAIGYNWFAQIVAMLCAKNRVERTYTINEILGGIEELRAEVIMQIFDEKAIVTAVMETVHETATAVFEEIA